MLERSSTRSSTHNSSLEWTMEGKQERDSAASSVSNSDGRDGKSSLSSHLPLDKMFSMAKGDGKDSYSKNSTFQAFMNDLVLPNLDGALEQVILPAHGRVVVADFGCSSGPNAIANIHHILQKLRALRDPASSPTEFQVFFNDLPSNDFNNLFHLLSRTTENGDNFFAAGVPGSFFARLFVSSSVHVAFSGTAVHYLSKIPDAVLDKKSPAFNKGRMWIHGATPATLAALKEQSSVDLKNFLNARAAELVPGGLLLFHCTGRGNASRPFESDHIRKTIWKLLDKCWNDLVSEGIVTEEQRDTFNFPAYIRSVEDVRAAVDNCGSDFHVQTLKLCTGDGTYNEIFGEPEPAQLLEKLGGIYKAALHSLVEAHIGNEASKIYWQLVDRAMEKHLLPEILLKPICRLEVLVVALSRK